jgi:hypothetical protein
MARERRDRFRYGAQAFQQKERFRKITRKFDFTRKNPVGINGMIPIRPFWALKVTLWKKI